MFKKADVFKIISKPITHNPSAKDGVANPTCKGEGFYFLECHFIFRFYHKRTFSDRFPLQQFRSSVLQSLCPVDEGGPKFFE